MLYLTISETSFTNCEVDYTTENMNKFDVNILTKKSLMISHVIPCLFISINVVLKRRFSNLQRRYSNFYLKRATEQI
jgi:hypothetical protein